MNLFTLKYLLVNLALLAGSLLNAANYYISNNGNDNNTGLSPNSAFATIQHPIDAFLLAAGDTVFVANGMYAGFDLRNSSGTAGAPIVFKAQGDNVLINIRGPIREDGINIENVDYIVIDGFIVNDMINDGNGIRLAVADNCVVRNCRCDNNDDRGIFTAFTDDILIEYNICSNSVVEHGIYVSNSSDRPIIRYNECFGNNEIGIHMNGDLPKGGDGIISDAQVYGNIIHDNNAAAGINMDGVVNAVVYNNLIFNNHVGQGIVLFKDGGAVVSSGAKIFNNTIIVPSDGRWGIRLLEGANIGTEIYNNIIINQHAWRGCITVESTAGLSSDYNIVNDKMSSIGDGSAVSLASWQALGLDAHSQLSDPLSALFVNVAASDFHLLADAQAVDTGTNLVGALVTIDLDGTARPQGMAYDIGAYEYGGVTSIHEISTSASWRLSPNPFSNQAVLEMETNPGKELDVVIYDSQGRLLRSLKTSQGRVQIERENFSPGWYFFQLKQDGKLVDRGSFVIL